MIRANERILTRCIQPATFELNPVSRTAAKLYQHHESCSSCEILTFNLESQEFQFLRSVSGRSQFYASATQVFVGMGQTATVCGDDRLVVFGHKQGKLYHCQLNRCRGKWIPVIHAFTAGGETWPRGLAWLLGFLASRVTIIRSMPYIPLPSNTLRREIVALAQTYRPFLVSDGPLQHPSRDQDHLVPQAYSAYCERPQLSPPEMDRYEHRHPKLKSLWHLLKLPRMKNSPSKLVLSAASGYFSMLPLHSLNDEAVLEFLLGMIEGSEGLRRNTRRGQADRYEFWLELRSGHLMEELFDLTRRLGIRQRCHDQSSLRPRRRPSRVRLSTVDIYFALRSHPNVYCSREMRKNLRRFLLTRSPTEMLSHDHTNRIPLPAGLAKTILMRNDAGSCTIDRAIQDALQRSLVTKSCTRAILPNLLPLTRKAAASSPLGCPLSDVVARWEKLVLHPAIRWKQVLSTEPLEVSPASVAYRLETGSLNLVVTSGGIMLAGEGRKTKNDRSRRQQQRV